MMAIARMSAVCLIIVAVATSAAQAQTAASKPRHAPDALPGVEPEMLTPEYWISVNADADDVIMSPEEIALFNERVRNKPVTSPGYEGPLRNPILPLELPDTLPGDSLRVRLAHNIEKLFNPDDMWGSRDFFDGRNAIYDERMKQAVADAMNTDGIPDVITRRFGIIVHHASVRQYPTDVPGYSDTTTELDRFQITDLCIGNPVAVLHESSDGAFLYVESPISCGWVASADIALADRGTLRSLLDNQRFLMAAGDRVAVYGDPEFRGFSRYFYMSATLPLVSVGKRGYRVILPCRRPDGYLETADGYIKPGADVHEGFLPYTKRSVIVQMFKLLNTPYGWHGQDNKRDCVGTLRVVFRCCGLVTGRNMSSASENRAVFDKTIGTKEKIAAVSKLEPVITTASAPGHIALYLGKGRNGRLYFMHQGGWGYKDENGDHLTVNRVSINEVTHSWFHIDQTNVYTTMKN